MSRIGHPGYSQYDHGNLRLRSEGAAHRVKSARKFLDKHSLLAVGAGRDDTNLCAGFFLHKLEVALGFCRQPIVLGNAIGFAVPSRQLGVDGFNLLVTRGLCGDLLRFSAVDLISDADGNFSQIVEHIQLGDDQPAGAVDHIGVAKQRQIEQPVRRGRPVTAPNSLPFLRSASPISSFNSVGKGPPPTRVQYALVTPITMLIAVGGTPVPVTAPPEVALDEVTKGYVPWSMSSMVPCAPSNMTDSPSAMARLSSKAVSVTNGAIRLAISA